MPKSEISQADSQKSKGSNKSKMISKKIEVDESLFGNKNRTKNAE